MFRDRPLSERADFQIGDALIRPSIRTVEGPSGKVTAEPRVMQVLLVIADAAGRVVSRDELVRRCWDNRIVGDDSINRAIAEVRRLARGTGAAFGIETIPRIGYRLTGVDFEEKLEPASTARAVPRRWVIAGAGAAALAGVGIWAWQRPASDDGFERLLDRGDRSLRYGSPSSSDDAARFFERAVALRPSHARAWGLLACARQAVAETSQPARTTEEVDRAAAAAKRALDLQPGEPNAEAALIELQGSLLDWAAKEDRLNQVLSADPSNFYVLQSLVALLQAAGRDRISWDLNERLVALDPLSPVPQFRRALKHWIYGRTAEADRAIDRATELWPMHPAVWNARFLIFAFTGRARAARAMIDNEHGRPDAVTPIAIQTWRSALNALETRSAGQISGARNAIFAAARVSRGLAAHGVMMLSALGDIDGAFAVANGVLLSRGPITFDPGAESKRLPFNIPAWRSTQWLFTPPCAPLRADARFGPLCDEIGLTAYWQKRRVRPDYLLRRA